MPLNPLVSQIFVPTYTIGLPLKVPKEEIIGMEVTPVPTCHTEQSNEASHKVSIVPKAIIEHSSDDAISKEQKVDQAVEITKDTNHLQAVEKVWTCDKN